MRYDTDFEQDSLETEELSDAFETGLKGDSFFETGAEELTDTEALDMELSDFEEEFDTEFDQEEEFFGEGEEEGEHEAGRRRPSRGGAGGGANVQQKINEQRLALAKLRSAVQGVGQHIRPEGGRLRFKLQARSASDAAAKLRMDPRVLSSLLKSLSKTNARAPLRARQKELDTEMDEAMWQETGSSACPGVTKFTTHWWGVSLWLNECHTKVMLEAVDAGSGAAGICAALAGGIPKAACAVAAGVLKIGGFVVKRIDALGGNKGIVIRKPWVTLPPVPPVTVWHQ